MKWSRLFLSLLLVSVVSAMAFSLVAHADELDQPETVTATETEETENGQSIGQDEQLEPEEPEKQSEIEPDTEQDETDAGINDGQQGTRTTTTIETMEDTTLAEIYYTLNSIYFCIVLCMACAVVFLVLKIVYPIYNDGL